MQNCKKTAQISFRIFRAIAGCKIISQKWIVLFLCLRKKGQNCLNLISVLVEEKLFSSPLNKRQDKTIPSGIFRLGKFNVLKSGL
jgi:hypothetical protein